MWTFHEFPVILVFCIYKILAKNQDSEFGCDAQDKRGVLWKSESEGLAWHSCDEIDYGNHDLGKYKLVTGNVWCMINNYQKCVSSSQLIKITNLNF